MYFAAGNIFFFEVNFAYMNNILVDLTLKISTSRTRLLFRTSINATPEQSFFSLVKLLSLLNTVRISKNAAFEVRLLLLQLRRQQFSSGIYFKTIYFYNLSLRKHTSIADCARSRSRGLEILKQYITLCPAHFHSPLPYSGYA